MMRACDAEMTVPPKRVRPEQKNEARPFGYFDGVVGGVAIGWCWRAADPDARLEVEVIVDGAPVGRGVADRRRENVARAGYGDGQYGFRVPLPDDLDDGATHRIAVRVDDVVLPPAARFRSEGSRVRGEDGSQVQANGRWAGTMFVPDGQKKPKTATPAREKPKPAAPAKEKPKPAPPALAKEKPKAAEPAGTEQPKPP